MRSDRKGQGLVVTVTYLMPGPSLAGTERNDGQSSFMFQTEIISNTRPDMAEILSSVFEKLDYLDDGFVDG